ncbi:hypothetical protein F5Y16DRAFT_423378 [Xylariaceae sp. FL0255]|nr:hypothetical protein F5Y16DRAFT_423378 [Xylariaceae sp. FL0255]
MKKLRQKFAVRKVRQGGEEGGGSAKTAEEGISNPTPVATTSKCDDVDRGSSPISPTPIVSAQPTLFFGKQTRGLQILRTPPNDDGIDIIFIHGLTGDSLRTWYHRSGIYWPTDLLPKDVPGARILSFGYDADVIKIVGAVGQGNLRNHASTLVAEYAALRANDQARSRKIVLIAHSLGGLVVKKALCVSAESAFHHHRVLDNDVSGLCFLGTPHRGADLADYASIVTRILKLTGKRVNGIIVDVLRPDSEVLADVHESFGMWWLKNQHRCALSCFYEEHEIAGIGMIVPKRSANLEGCIPLPIPSDHRDMARFSSSNSLGYKRVLGQIKSALNGHETYQRGSLFANETDTKTTYEGHKKWLKVLAFPELNARQNGIAVATPKTCDWIQSHPTYLRWLSISHPPILWLLGHPGTGKSTLMRHLSRRARQNHATQPKKTIIASFYFYNLGSNTQKTVTGFYRSLLFQLLEAFPPSAHAFREYHNQLEEDVKSDDILERLNFPELLTDTLNIIVENSHVWIFLDALDECTTEIDDPEDESEEVRSLIRSITQLQQKLGSSTYQLRMCCSCRHYPSIAKADDELRICTEEENEEDINEFIKCEFQGEIGKSEPDVSERLQSAIVKSAGGSFQWTKLVTEKALRQYRAGKSTAQIIKQIQATPRQLSELYLDILRSIPAEDRERSLQLFRWALFSGRTLDIATLRRLMNTRVSSEIGTCIFSPDDPEFIESEAQMRRLVQSLSGGLAGFRESFDEPLSVTRGLNLAVVPPSLAGSFGGGKNHAPDKNHAPEIYIQKCLFLYKIIYLYSKFEIKQKKENDRYE